MRDVQVGGSDLRGDGVPVVGRRHIVGGRCSGRGDVLFPSLGEGGVLVGRRIYSGWLMGGGNVQVGWRR